MADGDNEQRGGVDASEEAGGGPGSSEARGAASLSASHSLPPSESVVALLDRIAELEEQLAHTALLQERVAVLEERKLGVSLEAIKDQIGKVENRMGAIESRRDAWIRTLLLTLAAPLAAGVFGQVTKQRDVALKRFDQNLDLVDRALEFDKGPAYRKAALEYILDLNEEEEPIWGWASTQLEREVKPQFDDVRTVADTKVKAVKQLEDELEQGAAELEKIDASIAEAKTKPTADSEAFEEIAKSAAKRREVAGKQQELQQRLVSERQSANALLNQAGQAPIVGQRSVEANDMEAEAADAPAEPLIYIQVASFGSERLADAQAYIATLDSFPTLLLYREPFYVVMVGPYADAGIAGQVIEREKSRARSAFHSGTKIRDLHEFCAMQVRTADAVVCTPK